MFTTWLAQLVERHAAAFILIWLGTGVRIRLREGSRQKGDEIVDGMI